MKVVDFLIVGAGIIGLSVALQIKKRYPDSKVLILEKELQPGMHASGRNSGVLHAGFYYTSDSMKARFCREGNHFLTEYCLEKGLPINRCGKLVVAKNESELDGLNELLRRGRENRVELIELDEEGVKEIEPRVKTYQKAIFSPTTSTVSPDCVMSALLGDVKAAGVEVWTDTSFISHQEELVKTSRGSFKVGYLINTAGLYADKIALQYGFSQNYRILPFKGIYLYAEDDCLPLKTNVYPVPNLKHPFLGVHFTVDVQGRTKIGPTAIPALWREQYGGMQNYRFSEMIDILAREVGLFIKNDFDFRRLAFEECRKQSRSRMVSLATQMVRDVKDDEYKVWGRPGIRAQLMNIRTKHLEMDFCFEGDEKSFHILNAVSPGFTCSMPFSSFVVDEIADLIG